MPVQPRRTFAPSVVITFAGALGVATAAPTDSKQPPISRNPPAQRRPPVVKDPPPKPATSDRHWQIYKQDKTCFADNSADSCPPQPAGKPVPPCNPPAPTKYACPDNVTLPVKIIQRAGTTTCVLDYPPMKCPPGASCNPPPPRKVPCP